MVVERADGVDGPRGESGERGFEVVDRRRLMLGGLAAVAGAAVVASVAEPAAAANGGPVILGASNTATATTRVSTTSGNGLQVSSSAVGGYGVWGSSTKGNGVYGSTGAAGYTALLGRNTNTATGGNGVRGITTKGTGVKGESADGSGAGVAGYNTSPFGDGVFGNSTSGYGVHGNTVDGYGVYGNATDSSGGYGVVGTANGANGTGVYCKGGAHALFADGDATVVGTLSKGGGSFKIDHPLDPANKYLYHSFVESPDMKNVYDGVVTLDADGTATVELPNWFQALNSDYRYQLTPIGASAPDLHISSEIKDGRFSIAGGPAGLKVSWQVTGIRQDKWAKANRIPVEQDKATSERGRYLHPELFKGGKPIFKPPKAPKPSKIPLDVPVQ